MPHPKNRLKLTGDTHLPDPRFDTLPEDDASLDLLTVEEQQVLEPRVFADGYVPEEAEDTQTDTGIAAQVLHKVERVPARSPWLAIGAMLAFGWMVAKMLRR